MPRHIFNPRSGYLCFSRCVSSYNLMSQRPACFTEIEMGPFFGVFAVWWQWVARASRRGDAPLGIMYGTKPLPDDLFPDVAACQCSSLGFCSKLISVEDSLFESAHNRLSGSAVALKSFKKYDPVSGEKPYGCALCDKRFRQLSGLRQHERSAEHWN